MVSKQERQSVAERFAAQIIKELREGTAPWQKPWKAGEYHRPMNPVTGTVYKGINAVMLSRGYADPRWMTMRQANEQGWRVKKGSRAQQVIFWQWDEKQKVLDAEGKPELDASGKEKTETVKLDRPRLHVYSVFHASQLMTLDGQDIPAFEPQPLGWAPEEKGEAILAASGASITHDQRDQAFYKPSADEIHLPPKENFPTGGAYYSTALHELGHWSGHPSRLNREFGPRGSEQYAREELRAEISSWMLNQDVGLPHLPQQHLSYVDNWVTVLQKDPYEIMRACRDAEQIKDYVMAMEQKQEQVTGRPLTSVEAEINRAMADASRWDDLGAAREANKYASAALQDLADGDLPLAMERLGLAAEVEAENAADVGLTFAGCQAKMAALLRARDVSAPQEPGQSDFKAELSRLLKLSTLAPAKYLATAQARGNEHAAVFADGRPVILTGWTDNPQSLEQAVALAQSDQGKAILVAAGYSQPITAGIIAGRDVPWNEEEAAIATKQSGQVEPGGNDGLLVAVVLNDPNAALATKLSLNTETARILDSTTPELDDGRKLASLADAKMEVFDREEKTQQVAQEKIILNVPYKDKDAAKAMGAKWDREEKRWYAPEGTDLTPLQAWLPSRESAPPPVAVSPVEEFAQRLQEAGLILDGSPIMDGEVHRVPVEGGKPGAKDGAYCGYGDGRPAGWLRNFKTGEHTIKWHATGHTLTGAEKESLRETAQQRMAERNEERQQAQVRGMRRAYAKWMEAVAAPADNPYLASKGVETFNGVKQDHNGNLLVPGYNLETGRVQTVQHILPDGHKRMEKDCPQTGAAFLILPEDMLIKKMAAKEFLQNGDYAGPVLVAEGYATAASLHMATGQPVAVAFNAHNLVAVAEQLRARHPKAEITICADDDHHLDNNVGLARAREAAEAVSGKIAMPSFSREERERKMTDFNDLHKSRGLDAVKKQVAEKSHRQGAER